MSELNEIKKLFRRANVIETIDHQRSWINLNRLWFQSDYREKFYDYFKIFLNSKIDDRNSILIIPEGLSSSFGILPFVSNYVFEEKLNMLIWKEFGDILTITPFIFPDPEKIKLPSKVNCVIIQDVVGNGSTVYKIANQLLNDKKIQWNISQYLAIVQLLNQQKELNHVLSSIKQKQNKEIKFTRMFSSPELDIDHTH